MRQMGLLSIGKMVGMDVVANGPVSLLYHSITTTIMQQHFSAVVQFLPTRWHQITIYPTTRT